MKYRLLLLGMILIANVSCNKKDDLDSLHGKVGLYLIESFSTSENGYRQIDESSVTTKNSPLISYADFLLYDSDNHTFELSEKATKQIKEMEYSVHGVPFAVKVGNELIYTGYFWPSYSSASCDWVVIDPVGIYGDNILKVELGYPGLLEGVVIPDKRNDKRIINTFKQDNKLK